MSPPIIIGYLVLCFMVAILCCGTRIGFFRGFLYSIMLTPFLVMIFLLIMSTLDIGNKEKKDAGEIPKSNP